ncbi:hypothetical protein CC2G_014878 [Coprinopsis cinerea AmutBmut pab1-1]|nr:hypothetical protein CC2G_014878 [Coprinopsis cinerea AmutBmut pab1-1]
MQCRKSDIVFVVVLNARHIIAQDPPYVCDMGELPKLGLCDSLPVVGDLRQSSSPISILPAEINPEVLGPGTRLPRILASNHHHEPSFDYESNGQTSSAPSQLSSCSLGLSSIVSSVIGKPCCTRGLTKLETPTKSLFWRTEGVSVVGLSSITSSVIRPLKSIVVHI